MKTPAYVGIRRHTSAYLKGAKDLGEEAVSRFKGKSNRVPLHVANKEFEVLVEDRLPGVQRTSVYVSIRQHTEFEVLVEDRRPGAQHTSAYVSIRQHT